MFVLGKEMGKGVTLCGRGTELYATLAKCVERLYLLYGGVCWWKGKWVTGCSVDNFHGAVLFDPQLADDDVVHTAVDVGPSVGLAPPTKHEARVNIRTRLVSGTSTPKPFQGIYIVQYCISFLMTRYDHTAYRYPVAKINLFNPIIYNRCLNSFWQWPLKGKAFEILNWSKVVPHGTYKLYLPILWEAHRIEK